MRDRIDICNEVMNIGVTLLKENIAYNEKVKDYLNSRPKNSGQDVAIKSALNVIDNEITIVSTALGIISERSECWGNSEIGDTEYKVINPIMELATDILRNKVQRLTNVYALVLPTDNPEKVSELNSDIDIMNRAIELFTKYDDKWDIS